HGLRPVDQRLNLHYEGAFSLCSPVAAGGVDAWSLRSPCSLLLPFRSRTASRTIDRGRGAGEGYGGREAPGAYSLHLELRLLGHRRESSVASGARLRRRHAHLYPDAGVHTCRRGAGSDGVDIGRRDPRQLPRQGQLLRRRQAFRRGKPDCGNGLEQGQSNHQVHREVPIMSAPSRDPTGLEPARPRGIVRVNRRGLGALGTVVVSVGVAAVVALQAQGKGKGELRTAVLPAPPPEARWYQKESDAIFEPTAMPTAESRVRETPPP